MLRLCWRGYDLQVIPGPPYFYSHSSQGRNWRANSYLNRESMLGLLGEVPRDVLERFVREVSIPALLRSKG